MYPHILWYLNQSSILSWFFYAATLYSTNFNELVSILIPVPIFITLLRTPERISFISGYVWSLGIWIIHWQALLPICYSAVNCQIALICWLLLIAYAALYGAFYYIAMHFIIITISADYLKILVCALLWILYWNIISHCILMPFCCNFYNLANPLIYFGSLFIYLRLWVYVLYGICISIITLIVFYYGDKILYIVSGLVILICVIGYKQTPHIVMNTMYNPGDTLGVMRPYDPYQKMCPESIANAVKILTDTYGCNHIVAPESCCTSIGQSHDMIDIITQLSEHSITYTIPMQRLDNTYKYNTAWHYTNTQSSWIDKNKLVPFFEYIPYGWSRKIFNNIFFANPSFFTPSSFESLPVRYKNEEDVYVYMCSDFFFERPENLQSKILFVLVNDTWFANSYFMRVLYQYARYVSASFNKTIYYVSYSYACCMDTGTIKYIPVVEY